MESKEAVILVHGLWLTGLVTTYWKVCLQRAGFHVVVFSYASTRRNLSENAKQLSQLISSLSDSRINLIGHSLGGLLILKALSQHPDKRIKRIVLVGTPYQGSKVAMTLAKRNWGRSILGRSMMELIHAPLIPTQGVAVGVIAGSLTVGLGRLICRLPEPHDGTVSVEETKIPDMEDHIVLPVSHTSMLLSKSVMGQAVFFIRHGQFNRKNEV